MNWVCWRTNMRSVSKLFPLVLIYAAFVLLSLFPPTNGANAAPMTFVVTTADDVIDAGVDPTIYIGPPWCPDAYPTPIDGEIYATVALDPTLLPGPDGEVSLREAICAANGNPGPDTIEFNIPGSGPHTIFTTLGNMPTLVDGGTIIDGTSQPGYSGTPQIALNPDPVGGGGAGLIIRSPDNVVRGLSIGNFPSYGILVDEDAATGNFIELNYLGVSSNGTSAAGMDMGIYISRGDNNIIQENLISANDNGVYLVTNSNLVQDNYIGTDATGGSALSNETGIVVLGPFGGITVGNQLLDNLVSGNIGAGVYLGTGATNVTVQGNYVGTDPGGTNPIPNGVGVNIAWQSSDNLIGGSNPGEGNVISGNSGIGLYIGTGATSNQVIGNMIGTNSTGGAALGNGDDGVALWFSANSNLISQNVISGNTGNGVALIIDSYNNLLTGNMIGTDAGGVFAIPNSQSGVIIGNGATNNVIGEPGAGNIVSGNAAWGIVVSAGPAAYPVDNTVIQGNKIGTNLAGTDALGNGVDGISVGANNTLVGGSSAAEGNLISGNNQDGIHVLSGAPLIGVEISNNLIGTDISGASNVGNAGHGILIDSDDILVEENVIAFNQHAGVIVIDPNLHAHITRNSMFNNGDLGIDLSPNYGSTANDGSDADSGANTLLNYPEFVSVSATAVEGIACANCVVELFLDDNDPFGFGEGKTFLEDQVAVGGSFNFNLTLLGAELQTCEKVTATATDNSGNTSEFTPSQGTGAIACQMVDPVIFFISFVVGGGVVGGWVYARKKKPTWGAGGFVAGGIIGGLVYFFAASYVSPAPPASLEIPTPRNTFPVTEAIRVETETPILPPTIAVPTEVATTERVEIITLTSTPRPTREPKDAAPTEEPDPTKPGPKETKP